MFEVDECLKDIRAKSKDAFPFDFVAFTNYPHRYGEVGEQDPRKSFVVWQPLNSRVPAGFRDQIVKAITQYGHIHGQEPEKPNK